MCATTTKVEYVLRSSRGTSVMSFNEPEKAIEWDRERAEKMGDKAPQLTLVKVTTTEEAIHVN